MKIIGLFSRGAALSALIACAAASPAFAATARPSASPRALCAKADKALAARKMKRAFSLYRAAAVAGSAKARYRLGMMLMAGVGVKSNLYRAEIQFAVAAKMASGVKGDKAIARKAAFEGKQVAKYRRAGTWKFALRENIRCVYGNGKPPFATLSHCVAIYALPQTV